MNTDPQCNANLSLLAETVFTRFLHSSLPIPSSLQDGHCMMSKRDGERFLIPNNYKVMHENLHTERNVFFFTKVCSVNTFSCQ